MSVYAEWYWACQLCDDRAEEPWGDEQAARDEHDDHMRTYHSTFSCETGCLHRCPACRMGLVTHLECDPGCEVRQPTEQESP